MSFLLMTLGHFQWHYLRKALSEDLQIPDIMEQYHVVQGSQMVLTTLSLAGSLDC